MAGDRDNERMLRMKQGDRSALGEILDTYLVAVMQFFYRLLQNQSLAEKFTEEVFLQVFRARNSYRAQTEFRTWLFRLALRTALEAIEDGQAEAARAGGRADPNRLGEARQGIGALPVDQRAAILLHRYERMSCSQIADVLQLSELGVNRLLLRAYDSLRQRLYRDEASEAMRSFPPCPVRPAPAFRSAAPGVD